MLTGEILVGMQRIPVATQGADAESVIVEEFLEAAQSRTVLDHGKLAMRVADIISGGEFDGMDVQFRQFVEHLIKRELRKQGREDSNAHKDFRVVEMKATILHLP